MPELTAFVSERPQPKPRLSLLLTPNDELSGNPVYQNVIYTYGDDDDGRDPGPSNGNSLIKDEPKPKPRRRSSLNLHLFNEKTYNNGKTRCAVFDKLRIPKRTTQVLIYKDECDNECQKDSRNKQSISKDVKSALCNHNFQNNRNCLDEVVRRSSDNEVENNLKASSSVIDGVSPIKCMPYNSPRLTKASRGQGGTMQGKTDAKTSGLPKAMSATRSNKPNSAISESTKHQSIASRNVPCRSERGAVSTYSQLKKPSFKKLEEVSSLKENDSSSCSSTSSLNSIGETRRRTSSTSSASNSTIEKRKSAAVPPQLVANLTSKFNALISENHPKTNSGVSVLDVKKRSLNSRGSTLPTFQSCPSSPLRSHVTSAKSAIKQTKEIYSKDTKLPKLNSTISRSVESVKIKEKVEIRNKIQPSVNSAVPVKMKSPVAVKKKSFVQQAVLNYEVTLSSTSNSPELSRRNSLPKRSFSISDETKNDSFASPVLLRRMLLSAAEARAAKFTSESNHDVEPRRVADTNPRINQAPQRASNGLQEMPKTAGGGIELRCSSPLSRGGAALKEGRKSPIQPVINKVNNNKSTVSETKDDCSRLVKTQKQIVTSTVTTTKLISSGSLHRSAVVQDSALNRVNIRKDDVVSSGNNVETISKVSERGPNVSAMSKGRELMDRRSVSVLNADNKLSVSNACRDGSKVKATPPPLPTTQPRQINRTNLRRSTSKDTNAKRSYLHSNSTEKCNDARKENKEERSSTNSQNSFLHSKLTSGNVVDTSSREPAQKQNLEFIIINHSNVDSKLKRDGSTPNVPNIKSDNFKTSFLHAGNVDNIESKNESDQCLRTEIKVGSPSMEKKLVIEKSNYVPNTSFLWREMKTTTTTTTTVSHCSIPPPPNSAPPPIPEEYFDQNDTNIYDDVISPCSEELYDEPLYSDAVSPRHYQVEDEVDRVRIKSKDIPDKRDININNDSDEGWVDVSDTETEGNWDEKNASLSLNNRLKSGCRKNAAKRNSLARRSSWCQPDVNKIDSSKIPMNSAPEEYADVSQFDDDFTDSDESNSTNPDHHYEALYELNQHKLKLEKTVNVVSESSELLIKGADCILEEESPEDAETKQFAARSSLTIDSNFNGDKKEKRLKRNWSLTKSDIRLELTSRLNKIRIKKTSTSASDVHSVEAATVNDHKKSKPWSIRTRFSRKGYDPPSPTKKSPSPKKESALFYVPNCLSTNDGNCKTDLSAEFPRVAGSNSSTNAKGLRRASAGNVVRPREAPPAPPAHAKLRADSLSSVDSFQSRQHLPSISSDGELVQENDNYSRFSGSELNSMKSLDSDTESSRTRSTDIDKKIGGAKSLSRSNSTVSSENEKTLFFPLSPRTRTSIASTDSNDSYTFMDSREPSLLQQISDSLKLAAQRRSLAMGIPQNAFSSSESEEAASDAGYRSSKTYDFDDEPLYQFYTEAAHKRATDLNCIDASDDEYEVIAKTDNPVVTSKSTAMDLLEPTKSGHRSLWGELREVRNSGVLDKITPQSRSLQEAMFEVVTSEASYLKSLNILAHHFMNCDEFNEGNSTNCVLTKRERHLLFSDVLPVKEVSEKLLSDLEKRWQENVVMTDICDILLYHAENNFSVFIKYCSHQVYQERTLKELSDKNPQFVEVLRNLESSPMCQSLNMHSFLMLPMQRITRFPLLVYAIFQRLQEGMKEFETCQRALQKLNSIVTACNEEARKMARMEEMMVVAQSLKFRDIKGFPIMSASRWVIKQGELQRLTGQDASKLGFGRRTYKPIYAFLFTDLFVITKKKAEKNEYNVIDHCSRNLLEVSELVNDGNQCKNIYFKVIMLQNCEGRTVEVILGCRQESDRARWIEAIQPKISENPDEKIYEEWDCPQVQVTHRYIAQQSDELSLEVADVINVSKKVPDGWYQGIRLRDGAQGWFPSNYTDEIVSQHVRARNLKQRYRFLQCAEEQQCEELL